MPTNQPWPRPEPFALKDCALISIATGRRAQNLRELSLHLATIPLDSVYHHFWGGLLRPRFDDPEHLNDFAAWARRGLNDFRLSERLAMIDPSDYADLEQLRRAVIEIIEDRIAETEMIPWAKNDQQFFFLRSQLVVFQTGQQIIEPAELPNTFQHLSLGSIFYHVIDARRRTVERSDDFSRWLLDWGAACHALAVGIRTLDPYFGSLQELKDRLIELAHCHAAEVAK